MCLDKNKYNLKRRLHELWVCLLSEVCFYCQEVKSSWRVNCSLNNLPTGFLSEMGLNCVIGPLGRQGPADTLRQHCPQMTQRRCKWEKIIINQQTIR